jgi:hypothetical protein
MITDLTYVTSKQDQPSEFALVPARLGGRLSRVWDMHLDPEISWFLITIGIMVMVGVPRIRRTVWLPRDLKFQEIPPEQLTPAQAAFLNSYDEKLANLQFRIFKTFRVPNMIGHNLIRIYLSSADPAKCAITMVAAKNKSLFASYVEFATKYADGTRLVINNNRSSGIFDPLPGVVTRRFTGLKDVVELKRRHDVEVEKFRQRGIVFYSPDNYFDDFRDYHRKYVEYQASRGLLRWDANAGIYRATSWTALRGIRDFLNPIADRNVSVLRFLVGVVAGGGLPVLVKSEALPINIWLLTQAGPYGTIAALWTPLVAYCAAGLAIGLLFSRRTFIWALLLGVLPGRLIFGAAQVGYCFWMAAIADIAGRIHNRRQNIL